MPHSSLAFRIRINERDPAGVQIAEDLIACGGVAMPGCELTYGFRSAARRDEALRIIRGSFGTRSVEPVDQAIGAAEPAAPGDYPARGYGGDLSVYPPGIGTGASLANGTVRRPEVYDLPGPS
jgi:hypothetical protein